MPSVIYYVPLFVAQALWFLVPGLSAGLWIARGRKLHPAYVVLISGMFSCLIGYGAFWLFLLSPAFGTVYDWAIIALGTVSLVAFSWKKSSRGLLFSFEILMPLALWFLAAFFYTSLTFGCRVTPIVSQSSQLCYLHDTTFDNILPQLFANNIYNRHPRALMGDWHGSDRPPLQTGIVLFEAPFTETSPKLANMSYPILSTFLQVLWVPAVWLLGKKFGLKDGRLTILLIFCLSSGFFLFNSVFTWPKLLAGSLAALGFGLLIFEKKTWLQWLLATLAVTAALLAHGGVAFILLPLYLLMLTKRYFPGWKIILASCSVFGLLFVPWSLYQHFYDPPGNRVLKWEIAGVIPVDSRSFGQSLRDSYVDAGIIGTAKNKLANAYTIFYAPDTENHLYGQGDLGILRDMEFRFVFFGLGIMNLAWLLYLFPVGRSYIKRARSIDTKNIRLTLGIVAAGIVAWILIMFGPGSTIIHGGSYLTMILLFVCLGSLLTTIPRLALRVFTVAKVSYFAIVWILTIYIHNHMSDTYIFLSLASAIALGYCLNYATKHEDISPNHA